MFFRFLITEDVHEYDEDGEPRTKPLYLDVCQMMRTKAHLHYGELDVSTHFGAAVSVHTEKHHTVSIQVGHLDDFTPMPKFKYFKLKAWKLVPKGDGLVQDINGEYLYSLDSVRVVDGVGTMLKEGRKHNLATQFFTIKLWPRDDAAPQIVAALPEEVRLRFTFVNLEDECQTYTKKTFAGTDGGAATSELTTLGNFMFVKHLHTYEFPLELNLGPTHIILVKFLNKAAIEPFVQPKYIAADKPTINFTDLRHIQHVYVEVTIAAACLVSQHKLQSCFSSAWPRLVAANLEVPHYMNLLTDQTIFETPPTVSQAITQFGRQPNKAYVLSNCAIMSGQLMTHTAASLSIMPNVWRLMGLMITPSMFPKIIQIPYTQVRYWVLTQLWNDVMPKFWKNNELQAKAALMMAIMGVHASRYWAGESGIAKMAVTWLHSAAAGTGKTYCLKLINAMLGKGFPMHALSGSSTTVAQQTHLVAIADSPLTLDDYVMNERRDTNEPMLTTVRQIFDCTARLIGGQNAQAYNPRSTVMVSSNGLLAPADIPVTSRMIQLKFDTIDHELRRKNGEDALVALENAISVASCLLPDLDVFSLYARHEGSKLRLDKEALRDCSTFLHLAVLGKNHADRNIDLWSSLMYNMLLMSWTVQSPLSRRRESMYHRQYKISEQERIVEYCVEQSAAAHIGSELSNSVLNRFLKALSLVMPNGERQGSPAQDKPNSCIYFHNFRTTLGTADKPVFSIRVLSCVAAINRKMEYSTSQSKFKPEQVIDALADCKFVEIRDDLVFAATTDWPLQISTGDGFVKRMMEEDECTRGDMALTAQRGVNIEQRAFYDLMEDLEHISTDAIPIKKIFINPYNEPNGSVNLPNGSANPLITESYNFLDAVRGDNGGSWLMRAITSGTHAAYAGLCGSFGPENVGNTASLPTSEVHYPKSPSNPEGKWMFNEATDAANQAANFGSTASNYTMEAIGQAFGHEMPNPDAMPPCYERHAFDFKMNYTDGTPARVKYPADEHPQAKQFADEPSASPRSPSRSVGSSSRGSQSVGGFSDFPRDGRHSPAASDFETDDGWKTPMNSPENSNKRKCNEEHYQTEEQTNPPDNRGDPGSKPLGDLTNEMNSHLGGLDAARIRGNEAVVAAKTFRPTAEESAREAEEEWELEREIEREMESAENQTILDKAEASPPTLVSNCGFLSY